MQRIDSSLLSSPDLTADEAAFLGHIAGSSRGTSLTRDSDDAVLRIALTAELFPKSKILVVAKNRAAVNRLKKRLARLIDRPVIDHPDDYSKHPNSILVTTSFLAGLWPWRFWKTVIISDVESATTKWMLAQNIEFRDIPTYCIFNAADFPADSRQIMLEENFGPIVGNERDDPSEAVAVVFADTFTVGERRNDHGLRRKRNLIWNNQRRNSLVTGIARALVDQDRFALREYGLHSPQVEQEIHEHDPSVAILVENVEHGRQLLPHLPGWQLRDIHSETSCIPGIGHREVGTFCCAERWGVNADMLLRADGTAKWPLGISRFPNRLVGATGSPLLIDFSDRMDRQAKQDTASRRAAYTALGWVVLDTITGTTGINTLETVVGGEMVAAH